MTLTISQEVLQIYSKDYSISSKTGELLMTVTVKHLLARHCADLSACSLPFVPYCNPLREMVYSHFTV